MTDDTKKTAELQSLKQAERDSNGWLPEGVGAPSRGVSLRLLRIRDAADSLATVANDRKAELPDDFVRSVLELQDATRDCFDTLYSEWLEQTEALIERVYEGVSRKVLGRRLDEPDVVSVDANFIN